MHANSWERTGKVDFEVLGSISRLVLKSFLNPTSDNTRN